MKNLDDVLKKSLTPAESEEGPDFWLNQNILKRADRQEKGAEYEVQIDKVVRSAATHSGIIQFTVNRVSGKGEPWYILTGDVLPEYDYWTMETRNLQEINPTDTDVWLALGLESSGQENPDWRIYLEKDASDDETQVFYMVFNVMDSEEEDSALSLVFKELDSTKDSKTELANITVPESESIPSLTWKNENDEISVQLKDGSTYVIESKAQQVKNVFYSEYGTNNDVWIGFDHILDLEQVESVTINDTVFTVAD